MARVYLTSVVEGQLPPDHEDLRPLRVMRRCAEVDRFGVHTSVDRPEDADLILFVEQRGPGLYQGPLRRHPVVRAHIERCFCYCAIDHVVPYLPGVYPSQPADRYSPARHRGGHYLQGLFRDTPGFVPLTEPAPLLFSFRGRFATYPLRRQLARLAGPRAVIVDTDGAMAQDRYGREFMGYGGDDVEAFFRLVADSAFVLAPRGFGSSSMRLFEAMELGRAPVIVGDLWVPPEGPAWEAFSVRVAERDVARIPALLAEREADAARMGAAARAAWEAWFSETATFHRAVGWCLDIAAERRWTEPLARWTAYARLFDRDVLWARGRNVRARLEALGRRLRR